MYLSEYHDRERLVALLDTAYQGTAAGFVESDWSAGGRQLVSYLRPLGRGAVLYNTLGHCRGPGPHARGCWVVDLLLGKT